MPQFSAFTPFGLLAFCGSPSDGETIYNSLRSSYGDQFDLTEGTHQEASIYARAITIACANGIAKRAGNQLDPLKSIEMLPALERDWGVVPGETDNIVTRQQNVAAAEAELRGARLESVIDALTTLLGTSFVKFRVTPNAELATDLPTCNFARADLPAKVVTLIDPVVTTGSAINVVYAPLGEATTTIVPGDALTVSGDNGAQAEIVTVAEPVSTSQPSSFWATFTKSHDAGAMATTANFPRWISNQRHVDIVVTSAAALSPVTRNKIHRVMQRIQRVVSTWSIVTTSGGNIGPFAVGTSPMGTTCIGTVTL